MLQISELQVIVCPSFEGDTHQILIYSPTCMSLPVLFFLNCVSLQVQLDTRLRLSHLYCSLALLARTMLFLFARSPFDRYPVALSRLLDRLIGNLLLSVCVSLCHSRLYAFFFAVRR